MYENDLLDAFLFKYEGGDLGYENHEEDNTVIGCKSIEKFFEFCQENGFLYEGITDNFTYRTGDPFRDLALVFKDENDNVFWVHYCGMFLYTLITKELLKTEPNDMSTRRKADELLDKFCDNTGIKLL